MDSPGEVRQELGQLAYGTSYALDEHGYYSVVSGQTLLSGLLQRGALPSPSQG